MAYVADTVAIIRFMTKHKKLGRSALKIFREEFHKAKIFVPAFVLVEIMYQIEKARIDLDLEALIQQFRSDPKYHIVHLDPEVIRIASKLQGLELHDRLIAATAKHLNLPLLTCDKAIAENRAIRVIWH